MIRARCLRVKQHYPAQKIAKKMRVNPNQGHNGGSPRRAEQLVCWSFPLWINRLRLFMSYQRMSLILSTIGPCSYHGKMSPMRIQL